MTEISGRRTYLDNCLALAADLLKKGRLEDCLLYTEALCHYAWGNCTGYYANWRIEALLNQVGSFIPENKSSARQAGRRKILHVASDIYESGGHTRLLLNWCKFDNDSDHSIVITRQREQALPSGILTEFGWDISNITVLGQFSRMDAATRLRAMAGSFDLVLLHIHPDDVIPVVAFSALNLPPIGIVNHADHIFWIGVSVCDCLAQIRESNVKLDEIRRGVNNQVFVPLIVPDETSMDERQQQKARECLGIAPETFVMLTTGSLYKYLPFGDHNFFTAVIPILDNDPTLLLFIAGVAEEDEIAKRFQHPQIKYLGVTKNLSVYENACDLYLEGFPFSSFLALLQAARKGKPIHLMYRPYDAIRLFPDGAKGFSYPGDLEMWKQKLKGIIRSAEDRAALRDEQQEYLQAVYATDNWQRFKNEFYGNLESHPHQINIKGNDISFEGANELFLQNTDYRFEMNHFRFLNHLPFVSKIKAIRIFRTAPATVRFGKKAFLKFISPF